MSCKVELEFKLFRFIKTVETSNKKQEDTLSNPHAESINKVEYKALLPQYKEFSSDSDFSKSRDIVWNITNKKKEASIDSNVNKSIEIPENLIIAGIITY